MTGLERAGWALLALLTAAIVLLAFLRPTDPGSLVDEIRLAAGFDRYQAAMNDGLRNYAAGVAELRHIDADDEAGHRRAYASFARAIDRFELAREEAEGFHENQRAQNAEALVYAVWARALYEEGATPWYRPNDDEPLARARQLVDQGLALPDITGERRVELEELGRRIDRARTPWPIL